MRPGPTSRTSVVICAYTEERWPLLVRAVASANDQTVGALEVIVVVDHNDGLAARARLELDATVIENTGRRGLSDARNTGIAAARGDVIAFLDDDARADREWLHRLEDALDRTGAVAAGGYARPEWAQSRPGWFPPSFDWVVGCSYEGLPRTSSSVRNVIGCNMAFRRSAFTEVGGFNPDMGRIGKRPLGCEETELCIRLGSAFGPDAVWFEPSAVVDHHVSAERATWRYFLSRCYAEGLSKAIVVDLGGAQTGLSSERSHALKVLPKAAVRSLSETFTKADPWGVPRAVAIVAGLAATAIGYVRGSLSRTPVRPAAPAVSVLDS